MRPIPLIVLGCMVSVALAQGSDDADWARCLTDKREIDLCAQFPATDSQRFGDCVVHAESALLEAGFHRSVRGDANLERALTGRRLDRSTAFITSLVESGPQNVNVQDFVSGYGACEAISRTSRAGIPWVSYKLFTGSQVRTTPTNAPVADLLLCGDQECSVRTSVEYVDDTEVERIISEEIVAECLKAREYDLDLSGEDVVNALKRAREKIRVRAIASPPETELDRTLNDRRQSFVRHWLKPKHELLPRARMARVAENQVGCGRGQSVTAHAKDFRKMVRAYLCSGVPLGASVKMDDGPGLQMSQDAGFSWADSAFRAVGSNEAPPPHRMVLVGTEVENGKEYYLFRNSMQKGTADKPYASLMRIAADDACRIYDLSALITPADEPALSKRVLGNLGGLASQITVEDTAAIRRGLENRLRQPAADDH